MFIHLVYSAVNFNTWFVFSTAHAQYFKNIYKSLRCFQLYMGMMNLINCFLIWTWKVLCMATGVGTGYAAIVHFSDYPLVGFMYYVILLDCVFMYTFIYDKAFQIPALFERATENVMLHLLNRRRPQLSKILQRLMRSIPRMGIKVGEFHMMERESTLNILHYVLSNIVTVLVANRPG